MHDHSPVAQHIGPRMANEWATQMKDTTKRRPRTKLVLVSVFLDSFARLVFLFIFVLCVCSLQRPCFVQCMHNTWAFETRDFSFLFDPAAAAAVFAVSLRSLYPQPHIASDCILNMCWRLHSRLYLRQQNLYLFSAHALLSWKMHPNRRTFLFASFFFSSFPEMVVCVRSRALTRIRRT